jgi:hypothetical protein
MYSMTLSIYPVWTTNVIQNLGMSSLKHTYHSKLRLMPSKLTWPSMSMATKTSKLGLSLMLTTGIYCKKSGWNCLQSNDMCSPDCIGHTLDMQTKSKLNPSYIYRVANDQHRTIYGYLWQFMDIPYTLVRCHLKLWVPVCIGSGQCWKPNV